MRRSDPGNGERFDVAYLVLSGTTTAARCPELLRELVGLGFSTVIAIPTPNASRVVAPRELADTEGVQVVESYFDLAIRPRPPRGVVLFAPWILRYRKHPAVQGFTKGATAAAAGAIVGAAAVIATQVLVDVPTIAIFVIAFGILWRLRVPEPALVAASAIVGLVLFGVR